MVARCGRRLAGLVLLAVGAALGACSDPIAAGPLGLPPRVQTTYPRLLPEAVMPFIVTNVSSRDWGYGDCDHWLERLEDSAWRRVAPSVAGGCLAMGYVLGPGERLEWSVSLPAQVGIYRISFPFSAEDGGRVVAHSNPFRVGPAASDAAF